MASMYFLAKCPSVQPEEEEIEATKSKILSVGEVNLAAITESQQVEERFNFLVTQEKDLKGAVKSLFSTIEKIDTTTKQRFQMTFQEVDARFREIFASLFNGGEAWLELTGSEDSLDQGVNILVKPPGKRLQHVELLSGGEKALTAIAFIFAIFFCTNHPLFVFWTKWTLLWMIPTSSVSTRCFGIFPETHSSL